mmetsp:Transcript_3236/g.20091  ORF Transcript_3236/g.20091 Transcript_3236/m.20091 type:complete len:201 (-) Transcript_3236:4602-5204(-)
MATDVATLRTMGQMCVRYASDDAWAKVLAYVTLVPVAWVPFHAGWVAARRELQSSLVFVGVCFNEVVSTTLKLLVRQPRPSGCHALDVCHSFGFPSSHASLMFFLTGYAWMRLRTSSLSRVEAWILRLCAPAGTWVAYSRVYLGYHTTDQVVAGATLGALHGVLWHVLVHDVDTRYPGLANARWCRQLDLRSVHEANSKR